MNAEENADLKRTPVTERQGVSKGSTGENAAQNADVVKDDGTVGAERAEKATHGPALPGNPPPTAKMADPAKMTGTEVAPSKSHASMLDMDLSPKEQSRYVGQLMIKILAVTGEQYLEQALKGSDPERLKTLASTIATMTDVVQSMQWSTILLEAAKEKRDPADLTKGKTGSLVAKLAGKAQAVKKMRKGDGRTTPEKLKDEVLGPQD